jgi:hypothetical protein
MSSHRTRIFGSCAAAAILLLAPLAGKLRIAHAAARAGEQTTKAESATTATTTEKDQTDLSVTVYNSNLALVRDVRQIHLLRGELPLRFENVASSIMPQTVHFRSLTDPSKLSVIEQNYEYDLLDPQRLPQKYVGHELTISYTEAADAGPKWVAAKAVLLADNNGGLVWKVGDQIVTNAQPYTFPDLPGDLYSQPTLVWTLDNRGADSQRVETSYLTNNMNWSADYVLNVSRDEKTADLNGWVTLVNSSGIAYHNASLQLVAGAVHRTPEGLPMASRNYIQLEALAQAAPVKQFQQEGFGEYHLYTLQRRTSIQNNETKQISLLNGENVPVEKYLAVESEPSYFRSSQGIGNPIPQPVKVFYRFKNDEKSGLGMPLPAGTVRVYQADSNGGTQFAGEDTIDHTPKDEMLRIYVGNAFDVVCERKQTDFKRLAPDLFEMEYQITLRNHKDGPVTVEVREPIGGDWEVLSSNYKWTKLDATTIGFEIPVDKDGTSTLDYRVRVKW